MWLTLYALFVIVVFVIVLSDLNCMRTGWMMVCVCFSIVVVLYGLHAVLVLVSRFLALVLWYILL